MFLVKVSQRDLGVRDVEGWFSGLLLFVLLGLSQTILASEGAKVGLKPMPELQVEEDYFPGDPASHHVVYMLNKADPEYQKHILNSIQAMIQMYGGNVEIAVVFIGPGMNLIAKKPIRKVDAENVARVESFAKDYGVRMIACGNTMKTVGWSESDIKPFAEYALVGASALMVLQEKGYAYISW